MQKVVKKVRASLIELYTRVIKVDDKDKNIYKNGEDNLYPYEIERVINNSPTASRSSDIMRKFISGNGVEFDPVVNKQKGYLLSDVVDLIADDISIQYGSYIWVGYGFDENGKIVPNKLDTTDYANSRISKEDDNEYPGKVYVKDYTVKKSFMSKENKETWYYPFNSNPEVVLSQMKADCKNKDNPTAEELVRSYRGQVYYLNLTPRFKYALSRFDSVYNDMDSEYRFSLYTNTQFRTGFLGKLMILFKGLDEEDIEKQRENVKNWLGSENSGEAYFMAVDGTTDLKDFVEIVQPDATFDDKLFTENDKRIRRNILGAANNLPEQLVYASDGALFGASGEMYREMKLFYQEQTEKERRAIEKALTKIGFETKIIPIIDESTTTDTE